MFLALFAAKVLPEKISGKNRWRLLPEKNVRRGEVMNPFRKSRKGRPTIAHGFVSVYRSADFQSAVSPICNRQSTGDSQVSRFCRRSAGYKPAIQQTTSLRYECRQQGKQIHGFNRGLRVERNIGVGPTRSFVPDGTRVLCAPQPSDESLGYFRAFLRDVDSRPQITKSKPTNPKRNSL